METAKILYTFHIGSFAVNITRDVIVQWVVIFVLGLASYLLTRNFKVKPGKRQVVMEKLYSSIEGLVKENMGDEYIDYLPYVGTIVVYLLTLNLLGLIGVEPPTSNISVTTAFAISSFLVINITAVRRNGIVNYVKAFGQPFVPMLPLNIMERVMLPVSLALRLFGNMVAGTLILGLIYGGLSKITIFATLGLPIVPHAFFDLFDGVIQMLVFTMLTIINIKMTAEHH